jgi:hypothetical protein
MKIYSAQFKGTTTVATGSNVSLTGSFSGSIYGFDDTIQYSSSVSSDLSNLESKSASVDISISNINQYTGSNDTKWTTLTNVTSSLIAATGSYATTGSNQFFGTQTFSGSVYIANDLVVQGSSSIQYISASSVSIGTNIVQLNTANPSVRFAGLTIIDSGSIGGSGSFLYDSLQDEFIFVHRGNGTNVTSSHFVLGPETYDSLGNETYLTCNTLSKGTGKEHLVDSCIFDNGTTTCIKNNLVGTGTITLNNASANYATLNLNGAAGYGAELKFGEVTGGYLAAIRHNYNVGTGLEFYTCGLGAGSLRMYIAPTGNVGIGTSNPCTLLHTVIPTCYGTNGTVANSHPIATFSQCDCGAGARGLQIGAPTGGVNSPVFLKVNNTGVRFSIIDQSNCENFTISGGKIGIGITTPEYPLHIYNCNRTGMKIQTCDSTFGSPSINLLNVAVDTVLSATNTGLEIGTWSANDILFRTTQVERMRITSAGIACFTCQVCAPSGVKFGSGTTTLNYYEEGSWTPTFSNSSTTPTYIYQFGKYTRIGRMVHVVGKIGASNLGSGTVYIGGLPFSSADANDGGQRVSPRAEGDWSGFNCTYLLTSTMFRASGTTFIGVRDSGGSSIYADHSSYGSTLYFNFHGTYYV